MFEALEDTIRAKGNRLAGTPDTCWEHKSRDSAGCTRPFPWLNSTQGDSRNKVLCTRDVAIVHGPPGTGKTTTLVEAIYETLHRGPAGAGLRQSRTAVDWICEKLVDRGVPVLTSVILRVLMIKCYPSFTYDAAFVSECHPIATPRTPFGESEINP